MKNKKWLIIGAVAVGAYLIWKKMKGNGKEPAPLPSPKPLPPVGKPLPPRERPPKETLQTSTNKI